MDVWTGGRAVVELLKVERVRHIFGIVGATFLDVLDTLYDDSSVEYINVRHEQAAAFMADGLARVTDRPGVCLVTSGPGATNLITGVAAAYVAHSPVVVLVGGMRHRQSALRRVRPALRRRRILRRASRSGRRCRQGGALRGRACGRRDPDRPRRVSDSRGRRPPTGLVPPDAAGAGKGSRDHAARVRVTGCGWAPSIADASVAAWRGRVSSTPSRPPRHPARLTRSGRLSRGYS